MKIKITIETERLLLLRGHIKTRMWCDSCKAETNFLTNEDFQRLFLKSGENLQLENLHKTQTSEGVLLVCLASLPKNRT